MKTRPVPGRPRALNERDKRLIFRQIEIDREITASEIKENLGSKLVIVKTIYRTIREHIPSFTGAGKLTRPTLLRKLDSRDWNGAKREGTGPLKIGKYSFSRMSRHSLFASIAEPAAGGDLVRSLITRFAREPSSMTRKLWSGDVSPGTG